MRMKYWIYVDGLQRGPFTIDELAQLNIKPDTPVWYEGLDNWIKAAESPGLAPLLNRYNQPAQEETVNVEYTEVDPRTDTIIDSAYQPQQQSQSAYTATGKPQPAEGEECPPTFLVWSILSTICCCLPLGIVAIIYSGKVKPCWQRGDIRGAKKASEMAEIMIILSITLSCFSLPFAFMM